MRRSRELRKHLTLNKIRKRLRIVRSWRFDNEPHPLEKEPHRLHKWNLNCGCKMCHWGKNLGNSKKQLRFRDEKLISKAKDYEQEY